MPALTSVSISIRFATAFLVCCFCIWAAGDEEWVTINKDYSSQRYVNLDQITPQNIGQLKEVCEIQLNEPFWFNSGLLKVGRTLYVTNLFSTFAIDAATCELRWRYDLPPVPRVTGSNRGAAYWGGMIFRGTGDGRVIALDAKTGKVMWDVQSADPTRAESFVAAPVAWDGKVFIGIATSDLGVRGRIKAFDAKTGKELWRFYTIPIGLEPGAETWRNAAVVAPAGAGSGPVIRSIPQPMRSSVPLPIPIPTIRRERGQGPATTSTLIPSSH